MKMRLLTVVLGLFVVADPVDAQQGTVTGVVTSDRKTRQAGVQIVLKGSGRGTLSNSDGRYSIRADVGNVLQFSVVGTAAIERTVGAADAPINVELRTSAISLDAVEVTAMGHTAARRSLGTSQQTVGGVEI